MIHLDTSFVIDLLRGLRRDEPGPAHGRLRELRTEDLRISVYAVCELYVGVERSSRGREEGVAVEKLLSTLTVAYPDVRFPPAYGRLFTDLERRGQLIGSFDLLIATSAIVEEAALLTGNTSHFSRVPDLELITY